MKTQPITIDKSKWLDGPWKTEPDHIVFRDQVTGYPCIIHRVDSHGALCGYVGVPPGHPAHRKDYSDAALESIEVHGGLTYADECGDTICHVPEPGESDDVWWLGFDTAHCGDFTPAHHTKSDLKYETYRTVEYVREECRKLALQLSMLK